MKHIRFGLDWPVYLAGWLFFLCVVGLFLSEAHAETWPKVAFKDWPTVPVSKLKEPEPLLFRSDVPGSIQPKPVVPGPVIRYCNVRRDYGNYDRIPC